MLQKTEFHFRVWSALTTLVLCAGVASGVDVTNERVQKSVRPDRGSASKRRRPQAAPGRRPANQATATTPAPQAPTTPMVLPPSVPTSIPTKITPDSQPTQVVREAPRPVVREEPPATSAHGHRASIIDPRFSILFDLLLAYQPGKAEFSFLNYHPLLLLEIIPANNLAFSFQVSPTPAYFELDWKANEKITLRLGKIWIPFDDLNPHNVFGGIINTSRLRLGPVYFLPDIWAELGVGARFQILDSVKLSLTGDLYIVNGFVNSGAPDPTGGSADYPNFSDQAITSSDNNSNKSIGGRVQATFGKIYSLGASFYTGRWTKYDQESKSLLMVGLDGQIRWPKFDLKAGIVKMPIGLLSGLTYGRVGVYLEGAYKFGQKEEWKFIARAGLVDPDDRISDINDVMTVGGGVRYKPGLVTFAFEHYQDLKNTAIKAGTSMTFLRAVIQM